ncbi:MAG: T9SS type A sorting domain-containing protein, partial [Ferruginibacter sp.]|nr:T9SS type A sorting domain-containing protein [Ferruginibacter sp.]
VNGCISVSGSGTAAPKSIPSAPVVTVVNNCGSSVLSTTASGSLLWSTGATTSSITVSAAGNYTATTTVNGCTSGTGSATAAPVTIPSAPVITVVNNCGSSVLSTTSAGSLLWSTGATTSSITVSTAGIFTATTTVNGCISVSGSGTAAPKSIPSAPVVTTVNNCGSSILSTTASGSLLWSTGATTPSITVSTAGNYTATTTVNGCASVSGSGTAAPKLTPSAPIIAVVNNCNGTSTLSTTATGILLWSTGATTQSITVSTAGNYTATTTVNGCISASGTGAAAPKSTPSAPVVTVVNNCGSSVLSTTATGSLLWSTGATTSSITVTTPVTYTVTTSVNGCTSSNGSGIAAPKPIPSLPTFGAITQPNCTVATGSVLLNNLPSGTWTLVRNPGIITTSGNTASTTVSGLTSGSYTFTVTNASGCTSAVTGTLVINTQPVTPAKPVVGTITQPTCLVPTGTVVLSSLPAGTWTVTSTPSTFTTTGNSTSVTISGIPANNNYVFKVTNAGGCISPASGSVQMNPQPASPATPAVSVTQPTCSVSTGTITVTSSKTGLAFSINGSTYTNTNGIFSGLTAGNYNLTAKNSAGCISGSLNVTIATATACSSIGNFVFSDTNFNGIQDTGEPGINAVVVRLLNTSNAVLANTTTNSSGSYAFDNIVAGTYKIQFVTPTGYTPTTANVGTDDSKDSDPVSGITGNYTLTFGQSNTTVDAGFKPPILQVGNRVWYDTNNDGINGSSENGIANITVKLYQDADNNNVVDGTVIATTTTDVNGYYTFYNLAAGNYILGVVIPSGYMSSSVNAADPDNDNNADDNGLVLVGNEIRGYAITLAHGTEPDGSSLNTNANNSYDFGLLPDCNCINTSGNLLTNGSFENGTTGWTASGGVVSSGTGYVACGTKNGFNAADKTISVVYQDVTVSAGTSLTFSGFAGIHTPGLTCSPKLSLIFRSASGAVLGQTDVAVTRNVDVNFGQLALYTITATAPTGTAKVRVQSSTICNTMKMDAFCLRMNTTFSRNSSGNEPLSLTGNSNVSADISAAGTEIFEIGVNPNPVSSYFNIVIKSNDNNTPVDIRILNTDGRLIAVKKTGAKSALRIPTGNWLNGIYLVEVKQGSHRKVVRLVKASN